MSVAKSHRPDLLLPLHALPLIDAGTFAQDPIAFLRAAMQVSGDLAYMALPGEAQPLTPTVIPIHPMLVKQVLTDTNTFRKPGPGAIGKRLFGDGLITSEGSSWKQQRTLLQPAFHHQQMAAIGPTVTDATEEVLADWKVGEAVDVQAAMTRITLLALGRTLFGTDFTDRATRIGQAITTLLHCTYYPAQHTPSEIQAALQTLDTVVFDLIAERRRSRHDGHDLLSLLLQAQVAGALVTDQLIRDELMTFLIGGHETTAVALTWTWYQLDLHPEVEGTLHNQLDQVLQGRAPTVADFPNLPYVRMVLEESMRLYSPVWATSRMAFMDTELGNYLIPAGTPLLISPYLTHRHSSVWSAPERFYPERFCPQRSRRPRFAYIPFGGGPRQCIGSEFAMIEAQLILALVASRYRLRTQPGFWAETEALMTLRVRGGLPVVLEDRAAKQAGA